MLPVVEKPRICGMITPSPPFRSFCAGNEFSGVGVDQSKHTEGKEHLDTMFLVSMTKTRIRLKPGCSNGQTWSVIIISCSYRSAFSLISTNNIILMCHCTHLLVVLTCQSSAIKVFELFFRCHHNKFLLRISSLRRTQHIRGAGRGWSRAPVAAFRGSTSLVKQGRSVTRRTHLRETPF